jgi:hypothetical protein
MIGVTDKRGRVKRQRQGRVTRVNGISVRT